MTLTSTQHSHIHALRKLTIFFVDFLGFLIFVQVIKVAEFVRVEEVLKNTAKTCQVSTAALSAVNSGFIIVSSLNTADTFPHPQFL